MIDFGSIYKLGVINKGYYSARIMRWDYPLRIDVSKCVQLSGHYLTLVIL